MKPITRITSRSVVLPNRDIDTDQIIPARFLTTTSREGLGEFLFNDLRTDDFALNRSSAHGCEILVAGNNFGCGSSREHAPWALLDFGIRAVISTEIADIFRSNSLKNGLVPLVVDSDTHDFLLQNPGIELDIDVAATLLTLPDGTQVSFPMDRFARYCLIEGVDQLGYLRGQIDGITAFEEARSWMP
jgi:3-isopropylmalate/(R)-2-methylmalate dehydratase small subunit